MRNLIILYGPAGSGKTRFVQDNGLSNWHIDQASIRKIHTSPILDEHGQMVISSMADRRATEQLISVLTKKLEQSEFIICELAADAHRPGRMIRDIGALAKRHRYTVHCAAFGASPLPASAPGDAVQVVSPDRAERLVKKIANPIVDISHVDAIVAIGDIHANHAALDACLRQAEGKGKIAFLFCGDYINKGPEPAKTLRLLQDFRDRTPDCFMLSGNHELMLEHWAYRRGPSRDIFTRDTLSDLQAHDYSRRDARRFLAPLRDHVRLSWRGYDILATHGGLSAPIATPGFLSGSTKRLGSGQSGIDIDRLWERNAGSGRFIQIHGHRNHHAIEPGSGHSSYNLEGVDAFARIQGLVMKPDGDGLSTQCFSLPVTSTTRRAELKPS